MRVRTPHRTPGQALFNVEKLGAIWGFDRIRPPIVGNSNRGATFRRHSPDLGLAGFIRRKINPLPIMRVAGSVRVHIRHWDDRFFSASPKIDGENLASARKSDQSAVR